MPHYQPRALLCSAASVHPRTLVPGTPGIPTLGVFAWLEAHYCTSRAAGAGAEALRSAFLSFFRAPGPLRFLQNTWESVLQKVTLDPQTQSTAFSPKGTWKQFPLELAE